MPRLVASGFPADIHRLCQRCITTHCVPARGTNPGQTSCALGAALLSRYLHVFVQREPQALRRQRTTSGRPDKERSHMPIDLAQILREFCGDRATIVSDVWAAEAAKKCQTWHCLDCTMLLGQAFARRGRPNQARFPPNVASGCPDVMHRLSRDPNASSRCILFLFFLHAFSVCGASRY